jgi:hypothetical protein
VCRYEQLVVWLKYVRVRELVANLESTRASSNSGVYKCLCLPLSPHSATSPACLCYQQLYIAIHTSCFVHRIGQNRISAPYDRMYGKFPGKNTVCTPCILINVWFWPTLVVFHSPWRGPECHIHRAGQNRLYTLYMTVYLGISLPKVPYAHRICVDCGQPYIYFVRVSAVLLVQQH